MLTREKKSTHRASNFQHSTFNIPRVAHAHMRVSLGSMSYDREMDAYVAWQDDGRVGYLAFLHSCKIPCLALQKSVRTKAESCCFICGIEKS